MSERCILTQRILEDLAVTITPEGPIGCDLWGDTEIEFNDFGQAIIPKHLEIIAKAIFGREVDTGRDEK